jgi:hypothetical protein
MASTAARRTPWRPTRTRDDASTLDCHRDRRAGAPSETVAEPREATGDIGTQASSSDAALASDRSELVLRVQITIAHGYEKLMSQCRAISTMGAELSSEIPPAMSACDYDVLVTRIPMGTGRKRPPGEPCSSRPLSPEYGQTFNEKSDRPSRIARTSSALATSAPEQAIRRKSARSRRGAASSPD